MKRSFLKSAVALITFGLVAFGAAQVRADQQKLPSGTPYDQIGQKIENFYKEHEKTSAGLAAAVFDKDGKLYLSPILDLFNREIVAYAMSRRADSEMVKEMLEKAAPRLTAKGTMLHSDQGVLYRTAGYRELLAEHSMVQSMSRKANCWDNAPMVVWGFPM